MNHRFPLIVAGVFSLLPLAACHHDHDDRRGPHEDVVIEDDRHFQHHGYYDPDRHWHGGYYDEHHEYREDSRDWHR